MQENNISVKTLRPGDSTHYPEEGCTVRVHYEGWLKTDEMFDSSRRRGRPLEFKVGAGQVIAGWDEVIQKMSRGQIVRVRIPPSKAFGERGYPPL